MMLVFSMSLETGMGFYLSKGKINAGQLGILSIIWTLIILLIVSISYHFWGNLLGAYFSYHAKYVYAIAFITGNLIITFFVALFYAKLNFKTPHLILSSVQLCMIIALLLPRFTSINVADNIYISTYFFSFPVSALVIACAFFYLHAKKSEISWISLQQFKQLVQFSFFAFLINVLTFLFKKVDLLIVQLYCSADALGNYIQVNKLSQMMYLLPVILSGALFPMTAGGMQIEVNKKIQELSRGLIAFYLLVGLFIATTGYFLFPMLLGMSFNKMYLPFLIAFPGVIAYSLAHLLAAYNSGRNMLFVNFKAIALSTLITLIANVIFTPKWELLAAASISSISSIVYFIYLFQRYRRESRFELSSFFMIRSSDLMKLMPWKRI
ncbi:MAG: lipopolysaccharide biosynthesis protein [Chitinophagaceae bacterium]